MAPRRSSDEGPQPAVLHLDTAAGPARAFVHPAPDPVRATLVLGHGAGRGSDTPDLLGLAASLPGHGITVVRVDQPWVVAGRRLAPAPKALDESWTAILPQLPRHGSLVLGGRSAGARVACRTATRLGAQGVLALAFPLHPPGRPERMRAEELAAARVPVLVLQGERDAFGRPGELPTDVTGLEVAPVPAADHALKAGVPEALVERVAGWVLALGIERPSGRVGRTRRSAGG